MAFGFAIDIKLQQSAPKPFISLYGAHIHILSASRYATKKQKRVKTKKTDAKCEHAATLADFY
jgi:hypothetical protein